MIEIVFIIVILGILAAVALPKLAVNKNDAEASVVVFALADCIEMSSASYMKNAVFDTNSSSCQTATITNICFTLNPDNVTGILNVKHTNSTDKVCIDAQKMALSNNLSSAGVGINHQF